VAELWSKGVRPAIDRASFVPVEEGAASVEALRAGHVDILGARRWRRASRRFPASASNLGRGWPRTTSGSTPKGRRPGARIRSPITGCVGPSRWPSTYTRDPEHGTGAYNAGYSNRHLDRLIDENDQIFGEANRLKHYEMVMRVAADEMPLVPLYHRLNLYGVSRRVRWEPRLDGKMLATEMVLEPQS